MFPKALLLLSAALAAAVSSVYAQESQEIQLRTVLVSAEQEKIAQEYRGREDISREMINDTRDLLRYSADVGIADNGRHLKGFAMRGVEGNRVGISIDGVNLPDSEENSLYNRYGNFNNSRLSIDSELVRGIETVKGADSLNNGSGALGGSVNYRTLNAADIIDEGAFGGILRSGYADKNREWHNTLGFAWQTDAIDALLLYSQRRGHEMKSEGDTKISGDNHYGNSQTSPDPSKHRNHSYLAKFNWQINPEHRLGFALNGQDNHRFTDERSYNLLSNFWREADDEGKRLNANLYYEWLPYADYLATLRGDIDYQKTDLAAVNHKGGRDWQSDEKRLDEIFNRRMQTEYWRLRLSGESQTLPSAVGEHNLSFGLFAARRDFKNINTDTIGVGKSWESRNTYTIQYPVRTMQYGFFLKDHIHLNEVWSARLGIRYDYEKLSPRELNAPCSKPCMEEGKLAANSFANWNGELGLQMQVNEDWRLAYQFSTAHRVPTASEMYFTYTNAYGSWKSNPALKAERSSNHVFNIHGENQLGAVDIDLYHSRYRNFLYERESIIEKENPDYASCYWYGCQRIYQTPVQQMVNVDNARISGIEIGGHVNLHALNERIPDGFKASVSAAYSRGKVGNGTDMLSVQPFKAVIGLDYEQPDGHWGVFSRLSYIDGKKASEAKTLTTESNRRQLSQSIKSYPYLSNSATLLDVFGYYRPIDELTVRAGIYNIFDRRYHTWDALRGINAHSTTNSVDSAGIGLQRYYAPGRNFALSFEYRF